MGGSRGGGDVPDGMAIERIEKTRYNGRNIHGGCTSLVSGKEQIVAVSMRAVPALAVVLLASVFVAADETSSPGKSEAGAQPAANKEAKPAGRAEARAVRLTKPWKDLHSLSDDQKRQINQIHRKAVAEIKAVEQKEKDDIMALLNDQQKAELSAMLEQEAAARKAKSAQQKGTKPAAGASQSAADPDAAAAAVKAEKKSAAGSN